jgi:hypothetical protein
VTFWSVEYDDQYPAPDPFPVAAGSEVLIETGVEPDCDGAEAIPVLAVTSRTSDGTSYSDLPARRACRSTGMR